MSSAVIVTGAARGMGQSHALAAAELGAHVYVVDVIDTQETVEEIRRLGGQATGVSLDITQEAQWRDLLLLIEKQAHVVTGLVNNAGVSYRHGFAATEPDDFRRVLDVNVTGAYLGMRLVAPLMAARRAGSIVNIGSIAGATGYFSPSYCASKWALRGLTKSAVVEWGDCNVRINTVLPGSTETPLLEGAEDLIAASLRSVPAGRAASGHEMARVVKFLLSEEASYVNGADLVVDGGANSSGYYYRVRSDMAEVHA